MSKLLKEKEIKQKFISNMFGDDFNIEYVEQDSLKWSWLKGNELQDVCMKVL